jgi:hypothetical protein
MLAPCDDVPAGDIVRKTERIMAEIREEDRAECERVKRSA